MASYTAAYVTGRIPRLRYNRYRIVAIPRVAMPAMPTGYRWRELNASALAQHSIDVGPDVQAERFAQNLRCIGVFDRKNTLVGVTWLGTGQHREGDLAMLFAPPPGSAWDTGLWVPENKRLGRAFAAIWGAIGAWMDSGGLDNQDLGNQGLNWSISCIADYNIASLLAHQRMHAQTLGHVAVLKIGRFQFSIGAQPRFCWLGKNSIPMAMIAQPKGETGGPPIGQSTPTGQGSQTV